MCSCKSDEYKKKKKKKALPDIRQGKFVTVLTQLSYQHNPKPSHESSCTVLVPVAALHVDGLVVAEVVDVQVGLQRVGGLLAQVHLVRTCKGEQRGF